jgi:hypothetical protein
MEPEDMKYLAFKISAFTVMRASTVLIDHDSQFK